MNIEQYDFYKKLTNLPFIQEIWLFGSRSRGDNKERSDIDLAILCPNASTEDWHKVLEIIDEADTLLKIDCINFSNLGQNEQIRVNIEKFKKVIYHRKENRLLSKLNSAEEFLGNEERRKRGVQMVHELLSTGDDAEITSRIQFEIQRFEFVSELFWKILKKILAYEKVETSTPRDVLHKSFQYELIDDEKMWLMMLDDRNSTSHMYNEDEAAKIFKNIKSYYKIIEKTYKKLELRINEK